MVPQALQVDQTAQPVPLTIAPRARRLPEAPLALAQLAVT